MLRAHAAILHAISAGDEAFEEIATRITERGSESGTLARAAHLVRGQLADEIKGLGDVSIENVAESARCTQQLEKLDALCSRLGLSTPSQESRNTIVLSQETGITFERQGGEPTTVKWLPFLGERNIDSVSSVRHDVSSHTILMSLFSFVGVAAPPVLSHVDEEVVRGIERAIFSAPRDGIARDVWIRGEIQRLSSNVSIPLEEERPGPASRLMGSDLGIRISEVAQLLSFLLEREGFIDLRSLRHGLGEPMLAGPDACLTVEAIWNDRDPFSGRSREARDEIAGVISNLNSLIEAANRWPDR